MEINTSEWRPHKPETWTARFGTTIIDVPAVRYLGFWKDGHAACDEYTIPAGTRVKIVMFSRFGDVGITTKLDADHGYDARVMLDSLRDHSMTA